MTEKKIAVTGQAPTFTCHVFDDDDIFVGGVFHVPFDIGSQNVPLVSSTHSCSFLTRLSLQNDFNFRSTPESIQAMTGETKASFSAAIFPNPTTQLFRVDILENNKKAAGYYKISIVNRLGNVVSTNEKYLTGTNLNISRLEPGAYYVEILNDKDEKVSKSLIKL